MVGDDLCPPPAPQAPPDWLRPGSRAGQRLEELRRSYPEMSDRQLYLLMPEYWELLRDCLSGDRR
jgi:hypothetical protein